MISLLEPHKALFASPEGTWLNLEGVEMCEKKQTAVQLQVGAWFLQSRWAEGCTSHGNLALTLYKKSF